MFFNTPMIEEPHHHHYDFSKEVLAFFTNYQEPCAVITATSLLCIVRFSKYRNAEHKSRLTNFVVQSSQISFIISFMLATCTLIMSVVAQNTALQSQFNPSATSIHTLLMREFEFEFTALRWSFLVSILSLFIGLTCFLLIVNEFLQDSKKIQMGLIAAVAITVFSAILSYINANLNSWDNLFCMTCSLVDVSAKKSILTFY
jgi:hypothetical protein